MNECIFCQIINRTAPSEIVDETEDFMVIKNIAPKAPVHLLIISKKHIPSLTDAQQTDETLVGRMVLESDKLAKQFDLDKRGFKVVINCGSDGGQVIPHLHVHFLGGRKLQE